MVQHVTEMAIAHRKCQVFVDDVGRVDCPPVILHPHEVASGFVIRRLLLVFRRQCEVAGDEHHHVAFKGEVVFVGESAQPIPDGFRGAAAHFEQHWPRQLREQFRSEERKVRAIVVFDASIGQCAANFIVHLADPKDFRAKYQRITVRDVGEFETTQPLKSLMKTLTNHKGAFDACGSYYPRRSTHTTISLDIPARKNGKMVAIQPPGHELTQDEFEAVLRGEIINVSARY